MLDSNGLYALYRRLKDVLLKPTPTKVKGFLAHPFEHYAEFHGNGVSSAWNNGAANFVSLSNAINSGCFSLGAFCVIFIGHYITNSKLLTQKKLNDIHYLQELNRFYTPHEMQKQREHIVSKIEGSVDASDVFAEFTNKKLDVYSVDESQKNALYGMVKSGEINFIHFILAWHTHKFEVDESKITDKEYHDFIQYMKIVRQNMYKTETFQATV